jgi:hypothetical protein
MHFHVCVFEEKINKKNICYFCMDIDICPLLEGDKIIPLYTSFNLNQ